jgi:hypothetical protein
LKEEKERDDYKKGDAVGRRKQLKRIDEREEN